MNARLFLIITIFLSLPAITYAGGPLSGKAGIGYFVYPAMNNLTLTGGAGIALQGAEFLNPLNPAQWTFSRQTHIISGFNWERFGQESSSGKSINTGFGYQGTLLILPIRSDWSAGLSLTPYSISDYEIEETGTQAGYTYTSSFFGSGGLSVLKASTALRLDKTTAIGLSADYYFGKVDRNRTVDFTQTGIQSVRTESLKLYGYGLTVSGTGNIDYIKTGTGESVTWGASLQIPFGLEGTWLISESSELITDTTSTTSDFSLDLPFTATMGIAYRDGYRLTLSADLVYSNASVLKLPYPEANSTRDILTLRTGLSYLPDNSPGARYTNRIRYKAGFFTGLSHVSFNGIQQDETGLTGGFGLPLPGTGSILNLGGEVIWRGYLAGTSYKDTAYRIIAGISLTELWFQKRIID